MSHMPDINSKMSFKLRELETSQELKKMCQYDRFQSDIKLFTCQNNKMQNKMHTIIGCVEISNITDIRLISLDWVTVICWKQLQKFLVNLVSHVENFLTLMVYFLYKNHLRALFHNILKLMLESCRNLG